MAWFFRHRPLIYNGLKERRRRRVHACERGKGWGWGRRENFWIVVNNRGRLISHFPISESGIWWSQNEYIDDITKWTSCWSFEDGAETGRVHPVPQEVQKYSGFKRSHATARGIFQKGISYFSLKLLFPSPPPPRALVFFFRDLTVRRVSKLIQIKNLLSNFLLQNFNTSSSNLTELSWGPETNLRVETNSSKETRKWVFHFLFFPFLIPSFLRIQLGNVNGALSVSTSVSA